MHLENISHLHELPARGGGMDIIIVSAEGPQQEAYWESRLRASRGVVAKAEAVVCCVSEDWVGGAGNGLGTLYAFVKARDKLLRQENIDLSERLRQGASVAIYHTAGKGKRLFPLTASEYGNKAAVKLPSFIEKGRFLSILEAVIKQTGIFAASRKGRLSVFWGDQVFIPSKPVEVESKAHIDILALVSDLPSKDEWEAKKMHNYGLIAIDRSGHAKDVEKCDYSTVRELMDSGRVSFEGGAGLSLGCFSLSSDMLFALLDEFSKELAEKKVKMDSDPYFWMPMTLDLETYERAMGGKELGCESLGDHYRRMQDFKDGFSKCHEDEIFGVVDVGGDSYWWDYGTVQSYMDNNLKLCNEDREGVAMRAFLQLDSPVAHSLVRGGDIRNSVVVGVTAEHLNVSNAVLLNVDILSFEGDHCLLYNVVDEGAEGYPAGAIRADTFIPSWPAPIKTLTGYGRDGKADWSAQLPGNPYSYEELYHIVHAVDPLVGEKLVSASHRVTSL